jgi:hypothetical protein
MHVLLTVPRRRDLLFAKKIGRITHHAWLESAPELAQFISTSTSVNRKRRIRDADPETTRR